MKRILYFLALGMFTLTARAQDGSVEGIVTEDGSPVQGVAVVFKGTIFGDTTDAQGRFSIGPVAYGTYELAAELPGNPSFSRMVEVNAGVVQQNITFRLFDRSAEPLPAAATISEADLPDEPGQGVAGVLGASRDAFESAAAYKFSIARFRMRGYESHNFITYMNGAPMKNLVHGETMYYTWSGLNDMVRNRESVLGLHTAGFAFGTVGGAAAIDSRAAGQRNQLQASFSQTNRAYRSRAMLSYGTGILENGWSFSVGGSHRWASEGYIEGTHFNGWSYFASAEKTFSPNHSLAFTVFGAPVNAALASPAVQEMNDLAGTNYYNPNWGFQGGKKRNARIRKNHIPVGIVTHDWQANEKTNLYTSVSFLAGRSATSALEWLDAPDPRPDYYRNLPSFYYAQGQPANGNALAYLLSTDERSRQLDWDKLYQRNYISGDTAVYLVEDRVTQHRQVSLNSTVTHALNDQTTLTGGIAYSTQQSDFFKEVNDLLGAEYHVDINKFARQDFPDNDGAYQNDLLHPNRKVYEGDRFGYFYTARVSRPSGWLQSRFELTRFDFFTAVELSSVSFYRDGRYKNGLFPDSSYGKSATLNFFDYQIKGGMTYKIDGRNYLFVNALTGTQAPTFDNSFVSPRTRNQVVPGLDNEEITSVEGGYLLKAPRLKIQTTVFLTHFRNGTRTVSYFSENNDAFVNYTQTGIDTRHRGLEAGVNATLGRGWSAEAAAAVGEYYHSSRPVAVVTQDNLATVIAYNDTVFARNLHVAGTPQSAYTAGIRYNSPKFWFFNVSMNYFDRSYIGYFPGRRNREAIDLVEEGSETWEAVLSQEEHGGQMTIDLFAGWSWKMNDQFTNLKQNSFLVFQVGINNLLNNTDFITGGYEYARFNAHEDLEIFKPKYFYAPGTNFYINVALRFN